MTSSVSSTSAMRSPETAALGRKMNIIDIIRKAKTTCMAYCRNAIISPTCIVAAATCWAPTQMIASDRPFISSIITGIIVTMTRATNRLVSVRSRLAMSNRCASSCCLLKARTTIMPDRFSRVTRFSLSIRLCMILNFGREMLNTTRIRLSSATTATARIHHMFGAVSSARMTAPIPMIGA